MKPLFLALISGILLALGWPVYGFPGLLFFALTPLLLAEHKLRFSGKKRIGWQVFGVAYLSFFVWNLITTYWLYFSTPFGAGFAILVNSLLMALLFLIYHFVARRTTFGAASTFLVVLWICFEKLHLGWEFSWPWLNLGNAFSEYTSWIQWYEYTGTFGGSLWIWVVNIGVFKAVLDYQKYKENTIVYRAIIKNGLLVLVPIIISLIILYNYKSTGKTLEVVILQPNIDPYTEKYNTTDERVGELLSDLAKSSADPGTALVLAPETVFADGTKLHEFQFSAANKYAEEILRGGAGLNFLGGISFYEIIRDKNKISPETNFLRPGVWFNDYNSAFMLNQSDSVQLYHKSKLVVGVENFPYQEVLKPLLGDIMIDLGGTVAMKTTQPDREVFVLNNGVKTAPIICYESVYGEYVTGYVEAGADFLSIITNDAWWGDSQGHQQHLSYARLRAIETRRDIARSANTGISAFIDQTGKITTYLGYEEQGSLKGDIHLNDKQTFYVQYGDYIARISMFMAVFIFLFAFFRKRNTRI